MRILKALGRLVTVYLCLVSLVSASSQPPLAQCSDQGTWSQQSFLAGAVVQLSTPLLLTDGRVMAQYISGLSTGNPWQDWYALTPSITGCYSLNPADCPSGVTASWGELASIASVSSTYAPAAFASAVLPSGNVIVEGGENNFGSRVEYDGGAYYNAPSNTWTNVTPPSGWEYIGDAPSVVLPDGTYMLGNACGTNTDNQFFGTGQTALFDENTLGWNSMAQPPEWTAEASFTLLPNHDVLFVGTCWPGQSNTNTCTTSTNPNNSELYDPKTDTWSSAGNTPNQLYAYGTGLDEANSCFLETLLPNPIFGEQGPAALLPSGQYFATGGFVQTANAVLTSKYDTKTDVWTAEPNLPSVTIGADTYELTAEDQGSVVLTDGHLLFETQARNNTAYAGFVYFLEWNGSSYCELTNVPSSIPGQSEMLTLPTGQILIMEVSWGGPFDYFIYTPGGTTYPNIEPEVSSYPTTLELGQTYTIKGLQFNGATQSSFFGDDFQNATNYPLVRITHGSEVYYAKTQNPSTMAVATGTEVVSTTFTVPTTMATGDGQLEVVANGIPSKPVPVTVKK